jgi:hypothetical protein
MDPEFCQTPPAGDDESYHVDAGSIRPDRRGGRRVRSEIVGHQTRESFMQATGRRRPGTGVALPVPEGIPAAVARAGLLKAWRS